MVGIVVKLVLLLVMLSDRVISVEQSRTGWSYGQAEEHVPILTTSQCSINTSNDILASVLACVPRMEMVQIQPPVQQSELSSVVQMTPSYIPVERCSGSCVNPQFKCLPSTIENITVPIMLVQTTFSTGVLNTFCTNVTVERHTSCGCSCRQRQEHCDPEIHSYDLPRCQCRCKNQRDRARCSTGNPNKKWDPKTCTCKCTKDRWKVCSTGFTYDSTDTCSCIPAPSRTASGGLTFVILLVGVYAFITTVIVSYYRRKLQRQRLHSDSNLERLLREAFVDDPRSTTTVVNAEGTLSGNER